MQDLDWEHCKRITFSLEGYQQIPLGLPSSEWMFVVWFTES